MIVLPLLVYPYFEFDIEQDRIHKPLLIKQETLLYKLNDFALFCYFLVFRSNSPGASIRQGAFIR